MPKHICGVCGDPFDTSQEYIDHRCKRTRFTPRDRDHIKKSEEMYQKDPNSVWMPVPVAGPRRPTPLSPRPLSKVPIIHKKKKGFWAKRISYFRVR